MKHELLSLLIKTFKYTESQALCELNEARQDFQYLRESEEEVTDAPDYIAERWGEEFRTFADYL
jgi:hypothetical protein